MNQQNVQFKDLSGTYLQTPKHECKFNINVNYILYDIIYIIYSHGKHDVRLYQGPLASAAR